jgi:predicted dehydrogenase
MASEKASNSKLMVGLCFRYHPGIKEVKDMLRRGKIGRLVSIRALIGEHLPDVRPDYKSLFTSQYLGALDLIHDLDLALWFADQPVRSVQAVAGSFSEIDISAPDLAEILIEFEDRCVATVHLDFFQIPRRRQIELIGTNGTIILDLSAWDHYTLSFHSRGDSDWNHSKYKTTRDEMFYDEDYEFLSAVVEDRFIRCNVEEALKSLVIVDAVAQSPGVKRTSTNRA